MREQSIVSKVIIVKIFMSVCVHHFYILWIKSCYVNLACRLTDKDRKNPPKIGSIITYKFQELSKSGTPRFPTYLGIRIDMTEPKDAEIRQVLDD